jgi:basic membrane protein A
MKPKNLYRMVITAVLLMTSLMPACLPTAAPDCADADIFCVGLVTDGGDVRDRGYNQYTWEGILQAKTEHIADWVEVIETTDIRDYAKNIAEFAEAGYDVIVTISSSMSEVTTAAANTYPDTFFIGVDQVQAWASDADPDNDISNLVGITFPEEQAGFLMGALAAMMTVTGQVGAVCSTEFHPSVLQYCEGFRAGVFYVDPDILVKVSYHDDVRISDAFNDPIWGAETAGSMVDRGFDIIFGVGGETGSSAIIAAVQRGAYGLGADFDQYMLLAEASPRLLSSGIKLIPPAVHVLLEKAQIPRKDSKALSIGNFTSQVGYAPFHDLENQVPEDVAARLEEILAGVVSGEIEVLQAAMPENLIPETDNEP